MKLGYIKISFFSNCRPYKNMKLKVNNKHYALFNYTPYFDRQCNEIQRPEKLTYDVGDVVYIKEENAIGVVLGCVCESTEEVRTDMSGMVCFSQIEPATKEHFQIKGVRFQDLLYKEVFGGLKLAVTDEALDAALKKFEGTFDADETRLPFIQFNEEKTVKLEKRHNVYYADNSTKHRMMEFYKQRDAVAFFQEIGFTVTK